MTMDAARPEPAVGWGRKLIFAATLASFPVGVGLVAATWWNGWSWLGAALVSLSPMAASQLYGRWFRPKALRPAVRRYNRRLIVTMALYVVVMMGAVMLYERGLTAGPAGYLAALAPAVPVMACFLHLGRLLREESDEFQRTIMSQAMLWAGGLTMAEATAWGFLETFAKAPHVWMWVVPLAFFVQLGAAMPLAAMRYR